MDKTNCPNCGAPKQDGKCPYCGTMLEDPENVMKMALGKKVSVRFEAEGRLYEFDMVLDNASIDGRSNPTCLYADGMVCHTIYSPEYEAMFRGRLVPSEMHGGRGLYFVRELFVDEMTA